MPRSGPSVRRVLTVALALIAVAALLVVVLRDDQAPPRSGPVEGGRVLPIRPPDLVNPMRGQFDNIGTGLFPQSNPAQTGLPDWPGTRDAAIRVTWRSLQPVDPATLPADAADDERYDFRQVDQALDRYGARGMRMDLRVSSYDSCCDPTPPGNVVIGVPDWLAASPGAVDTYDRDGVTQVIPDWNSEAYLDGFTDLLSALGRRYDGDERLSVFEFSGYGDFSENQLAILRDDLDDPGPAPEESEAELGYYSQYEDQVITAGSARRLARANLEAFPRTQVVTATSNPQIVKELMRDSDALGAVVHPVGVRADCLGVLGVLPAWATSPYSRYVERRDPIIAILRQRLLDAPVLTEWCQLPEGTSRSAYYRRGLQQVIARHVSMTASSGFPDQLDDAPMDPDLYRLWVRANLSAGYRYDARAQAVRGEVGGDGLTAT